MHRAALKCAIFSVDRKMRYLRSVTAHWPGALKTILLRSSHMNVHLLKTSLVQMAKYLCRCLTSITAVQNMLVTVSERQCSLNSKKMNTQISFRIFRINSYTLLSDLECYLCGRQLNKAK